MARILASALAFAVASGMLYRSDEPGADGSTAAAPAEKPSKKEPIINTVTMDDGRIVEFKGKQRMIKESTVDEDGVIKTRLDFLNGETRYFNLNPSDALFARFAQHGVDQKLGDEIAGVTDIDDAVEAVHSLIERLNAGEWTVTRESNGLAGASMLVKALVELKGLTPDAVRTFLKDKTTAQKAALKANPAVAPIIARLEQEKAEKAGKQFEQVNSDELLGTLGA